MIAFTEEQLRAIGRRDGSVLVSAGAGAGKTSVLVERFVRAVLDDGVAVDSVLAITFTEKAAAQLAGRVRRRFSELGAHEQARSAEGAWISTIHGFCARLLRTHSLVAGIDPEFRVLDAVETDRLGLDAFDRALRDFLGAGDDSGRLRMLAAYTPERLGEMVLTAYGHLRSQGQSDPSLPAVEASAPAGEHERLRASVAEALRELDGVEGKMVAKARGRLEGCAELLGRLGPEEAADLAAVRRLVLSGNAKALRGPACEAYSAEHDAYVAYCMRVREAEDHALLRELLALYGRRYGELKRARSALDFDDLELQARNLLRDDARLREHYSDRFAHIMIDEFQDTNPLQNEILELLERDNLFRVGDERQSIYRFRHADLEVFRRHRQEAAQSGRGERISMNFRSRGELLDAINLTFSQLWGGAFEPLAEAPAARAEPPRVDPCVELLVTDRDKGRWDERFAAELAAGEEPFGPTMAGVTPWRAAEARLLARRIEDLTADGRFAYREVVVLLRATTSMGVYERALEERGIPTHVLGGRGYWSQQQVGDLRAHLAALANPLDELALVSALASPIAGVSLDSLIQLAVGARRSRWSLWRMVDALTGGREEISGSPVELPDEDRSRLRSFAERFRAERRDAPRLSLETLIDRVVTDSGYDTAVLAMPAGDRRMANVRKLMRLAREYEAAEGRDLRGFIDFVAERDLAGEREGEAPLEAEDLDAVRLMTVHRAKGLEFRVTCVADLGKAGREDDSALRVSPDGQVGIRLASLEGGALDSAALSEMRERQRLEDEEEERRIFYVAATRACEHLILSGATDLEKLPEPAPLEEPMRWILRALAPELVARSEPVPDGAPGGGMSYGGRPVDVRRVVVRPSTVDDELPAAGRVPTRPETPAPGLDALDAPALRAVAVPPALAVSRSSYSALERLRRCGYRFYAQDALGLPGGDDLALGGRPSRSTGLSARARGAIVHRMLERLDPKRPTAPTEEAVAKLAEAERERLGEVDYAELAGLVRAFAESPMRQRLADARRVRTELPFAFELGVGGERALLINGVVDVHAEEDDGLLIVDYKSDRLAGRSPAEVVELGYTVQQTVYALAGLKGGARRVEVAHLFLERPLEPVGAVFDADDEAGLEARLGELGAGVATGAFKPSAAPGSALCSDCPAQPGLCSWDTARTLEREPV